MIQKLYLIKYLLKIMKNVEVNFLQTETSVFNFEARIPLERKDPCEEKSQKRMLGIIAEPTFSFHPIKI